MVPAKQSNLRLIIRQRREFIRPDCEQFARRHRRNTPIEKPPGYVFEIFYPISDMGLMTEEFINWDFDFYFLHI